MADTRERPSDRGPKGPASTDLQALAKQLREQALKLGDADAIATADKIHEHAHAEPPNVSQMRSLLNELETKLALSPTVNAIVQALTNVGL
jgi:hypothetical protein